MEKINTILNEISISLEKISIQNRINNYNLISKRLNKPQYTASFNDILTGNSQNTKSMRNIVSLTETEQSLEQIMMQSIDLSSKSGQLVDVLNRRLEIERLVMKGMR